MPVPIPRSLTVFECTRLGPRELEPSACRRCTCMRSRCAHRQPGPEQSSGLAFRSGSCTLTCVVLQSDCPALLYCPRRVNLYFVGGFIDSINSIFHTRAPGCVQWPSRASSRCCSHKKHRLALCAAAVSQCPPFVQRSFLIQVWRLCTGSLERRRQR